MSPVNVIAVYSPVYTKTHICTKTHTNTLTSTAPLSTNMYRIELLHGFPLGTMETGWGDRVCEYTSGCLLLLVSLISTMCVLLITL